MGINLSIKDVPEDLAQRLRERAARNHRSLQGELMAIVEQAAGPAVTAPPAVNAHGADAPDGCWVQGWKTIEQLVAEREARGWKPDPIMATLPRGVDIIRADRDNR